MSYRTGNLSENERGLSGLYGLALSLVAMQRGNILIRGFTAIAGAGLLVRAVAGHCAVKAAVHGHTSLRGGMSDQWRHLRRRSHTHASGLPGSPLHDLRSSAVDASVEDSFPASDAPASHLPDEPPVNAEAKWAAARSYKETNGGGGA